MPAFLGAEESSPDILHVIVWASNAFKQEWPVMPSGGWGGMKGIAEE